MEDKDKKENEDIMNIKFGDEVEPTGLYADNKKRKFIFMSWMARDLAGYARIATLLVDGDGHDPQGIWVKGFGLVLTGDSYVHKSKIKILKKNEN
ncbi:hypothetical protein LCGC14_1621790 [marine sediment metagenome]|uniref:Uncharacterized protein n=1 Tax=marine sediment metagenome TaxID=412755 RepID=A0A0F9KKU3_9ZZZZ